MTKNIIWKRDFDVNSINKKMNNTMISHIEIEIIEVGNNYIKGTMPVNKNTKQPFGLLHGGASVTLAETLGSIAANMCIEENKNAVGLEINANHLKAVRDGFVEGTAKIIHLGKRTQVWEIKITNNEQISCISRLTMAVVDNKVPS
tara:strand:- start:93 stop:530 length:438 start_codon:yes stop_codon:yes gene_type:complete